MAVPILVIGDFLRDVFYDMRPNKSSYNVNSRTEFAGGASATLSYVAKLGGLDCLDKGILHLADLQDHIINNSTRIERYGEFNPVTNKFITHLTVNKEPKRDNWIKKDLISAIADLYSECAGKDIILVISDYDKGFLDYLVTDNDWNKFISSKNVIATIVDSRYRSIPLELLNLSKVNIWHATGSEYDIEYAKKFTYTYFTNGPNKAELLAGQQQVRITDYYIPHNVIPVDVTGAGDCFTAAIATYLASLTTKICLDDLIDAGRYAILNCQEVVQTPFTKIPELMIPIRFWHKETSICSSQS